jgi:hypothetical protein
MTGPAPKWQTPPNLGRFGGVLFARQAEVGTPMAAPTHALKATTFMQPLVGIIRTTPAYGTGTVFNPRPDVQGYDTSAKTVACEMTHAAFRELLIAALGPLATGTITPQNANYDALSPGQPLTLWQLHPTGHQVCQDVQITSIAATINARGNVTAQIGFMVLRSAPLTTTPPVVVTPLDQLKFAHWYLKVNTALYKPEQGSINLTIAMAVVDGADGTNPSLAMYPVGYERNGPVGLEVDFTLPTAPAVLKDAFSNIANLDVRVQTGFQVPGAAVKTLEFDLTTAMVTQADIGTGTDRVTTQFKTMAVVGSGPTPFLITAS